MGRQGPQAEVLGFAQDDMVQRFVHGLDPALKLYFDNRVEVLVRRSFLVVLSALQYNDAQVTNIMGNLDPVIAEMVAKHKDASEEYVENTFTSHIKDMVRSMPKQELAILAESLVELTSLKRKVSRDKETVGGEVDVAIISKSEGFVWKKRKHYFPADLNPRFFARRFPGTTVGVTT